MSESAIERKVVNEARKIGVLGLKLMPPGETGWPDRIFFIFGGEPLLIEFKAPGEEPRPKQSYTHRLLTSMGYRVEVHDDVDEALASIRRALKGA